FDLPLDGDAAPTVRALLGATELPLLLEGTDDVAHFSVRVAVPAWSWAAIALMPQAPATPAAAALLTTNEHTVTLRNDHVVATWSRSNGRFTLTSLELDGTEALAGASAVVQDYDDDGGLYRMGQEMPGCALTARSPVDGDDTVTVIAHSP